MISRHHWDETMINVIILIIINVFLFEWNKLIIPEVKPKAEIADIIGQGL